jgi:hypothetical protein
VTALVQAVGQLVDLYKPDEVKLLLSDNLVRYLCLPWRVDLRNAAERSAYASMLFDDTYGEGSHADWTLACDQWYPGKSCLLSAAPNKLLEGVKTSLHQAKVKLVSVRPFLVASLRLCCSSLPKVGWLVSHEAGRMSLVGWNAQGWQWVSSGSLAADTLDGIVSSLKRELVKAISLPADLDNNRSILVFAPTLSIQDGPTSNGLQLTSWKIPRKLLATFQDKTSPTKSSAARNDYLVAFLGAAS